MELQRPSLRIFFIKQKSPAQILVTKTCRILPSLKGLAPVVQAAKPSSLGVIHLSTW